MHGPRGHVAGDELHDGVERTFVREPIALDVDSEAADATVLRGL